MGLLALGWVILLKAQRIGRLCGVADRDMGWWEAKGGLEKAWLLHIFLFLAIGLS
jgi:hypothetical protein